MKYSEKEQSGKNEFWRVLGVIVLGIVVLSTLLFILTSVMGYN